MSRSEQPLQDNEPGKAIVEIATELYDLIQATHEDGCSRLGCSTCSLADALGEFLHTRGVVSHG